MNNIILGIAITFLAKEIYKYWHGSRDKIETYLTTRDDVLAEYVKNKWNITIPEGVHNAYDWLMSAIVEATDKAISDGPFLRNVLRAIRSKDPEKAAQLLEQFQAYYKDILAGVLDNIPAELKDIINAEKEKIAVKIAFNKIPLALPNEKHTEEEIVADIKRAAAANKINELGKHPIDESTVEKLIRESQERQRKLLAK
jgi:hypothetical protein